MANILSDISQDPDITLHILGNYIGSAYSPQVDVTETATGHDVAITYDDAEEGIKTKTFSVPDGEDYVLTQEDRTTIAGIVEDDLDTYIDAMSRATATANQQEQARATAESGRVTAEQARQSAETARNQAEGTRTQAESQRAESERQRGAAEQSRATAETARATAETQRQNSEQARQTAEGARATAEQARATAETQRAENEAQRASAETSRASAESTRASEWATIKAAAQAATAGAENVDATMTKSGSVATVTVTDRNGTAHTATLTDGVSPTASVERVDGGAVVTVTDASGTTTAMLNDAIGISSAADALMGEPSESTWSRRTSAGSGMARVESVQGAAVGWNQLIQLVNSVSPSWGITISTDPATGLVGFSGTASGSGGRNNYVAANIPLKSGNKYLIRDTLNYAASGNETKWTFSDVSGSHPFVASIQPNTVYTYSGNDVTCWIGKTFNTGEVYDCSGYVSLYDLTQMFGAGNEPATVAEFERMFPEAYYPYSAPTLKPVQIAGIESTDAQGGELDGVEWETQTLRAAGSVRDELTAGELVTRVGVVDLGTLTWSQTQSGVDTYSASVGGKAYGSSNLLAVGYNLTNRATTEMQDMDYRGHASSNRVYFRNDNYDTPEAFRAAMSGVLLYYELATPTTTPISPALPMTYRVEQGGTESIVVPEGEVSAAPLITLAEGESAADLVMAALAAIAAPDGPTATANHAVGTYLTMGGKLYKVTTAIAAGETIAAGTNVTQTTVMDELIAHTA